MNKDTAKEFKVIAAAGITVITPPVHFDVNTHVVLNEADQRTIDQLANGEIEAVEATSDEEVKDTAANAGDVTNDDGSITHTDGSVTHPDGSVTDAEGKVTQLPIVDGETRNEDGSVTHADGTTTHLDGSVTDAEGNAVVA